MLNYLLTLLETEDDKSLLLEVYEKYGKLVNFVASDGLDNISNVDDCVQDTFVELIKSFENFKRIPEEKRRAYIIRICKRIVYRTNEDNYSKVVSYEEQTDDNYSDKTEYDFSEFDRADMALIIKELNPKYREPIIMKYGSGLSTIEISELLGISQNLVLQRIYRGKRMLYKLLTEG